jgi:peroxiredoxin
LCALSVSAQGGQLPPLPQGTPKVGQKAPDFTLPDHNGKPAKLSVLLGESKAAKHAPAALLIFYRGYW